MPKGLQAFYDKVYDITMFICKLFLVADIVVVSFTVAGRYIPFIPDPSWTEEVTLTVMTYMAVLSAALAIHRNAHIRMTVFDVYLPDGLLKVLDLISDIAVTVLALVMLVIGWNYANKIGAQGAYTSMPWLSKRFQFYPIPLAGLAMLIFESECLIKDVLAFKKGGAK